MRKSAKSHKKKNSRKKRHNLLYGGSGYSHPGMHTSLPTPRFGSAPNTLYNTQANIKYKQDQERQLNSDMNQYNHNFDMQNLTSGFGRMSMNNGGRKTRRRHRRRHGGRRKYKKSRK